MADELTWKSNHRRKASFWLCRPKVTNLYFRESDLTATCEAIKRERRERHSELFCVKYSIQVRVVHLATYREFSSFSPYLRAYLLKNPSHLRKQLGPSQRSLSNTLRYQWDLQWGESGSPTTLANHWSSKWPSQRKIEETVASLHSLKVYPNSWIVVLPAREVLTTIRRKSAEIFSRGEGDLSSSSCFLHVTRGNSYHSSYKEWQWVFLSPAFGWLSQALWPNLTVWEVCLATHQWNRSS